MPKDPATRYSRIFESKNNISLEDAAASDPNVLLAQYRRNGTLPAVQMRQPLHGDFTGPTDLQDQMEAVDAAWDRFNALPADVRTACENSPVRFLAMIEDPDQRAVLESAGLQVSDTPLTETTTSPSATPEQARQAGTPTTEEPQQEAPEGGTGGSPPAS